VDEPTWIREDVVLSIHRRQLAEHGGAEGLRNPGQLSSALARPKNLFAYDRSKADLAALAAAYAFGIINDHPFLDGNKRVALIVLRTFLLLNGHDIAAGPRDKYLIILKTAEGQLSEDGLAAWTRAHLRAL
jgi:death-on-curing protein